MDRIVEELKKIKEENGLTNADVSKMSGVPVGTVNRVFSGTNGSHSYATIEPIKEALLPLAKPEEVRHMHEEKNKVLVGEIEQLYERMLTEKEKELHKCERFRNISLIANVVLVFIIIVFLFIDILHPDLGWIRQALGYDSSIAFGDADAWASLFNDNLVDL